MSSLTIRTIRELATALDGVTAKQVPARALHHAPGRGTAYPAVIVEPGERWRFTPCQHEELFDAGGDAIFHADGRAAFEVGQLTGRARIWCGAHEDQRFDIEDAILEAFCDDDRAPGRLLLDLTDVQVSGQSLGVDWKVACMIDEDGWQEELVFSERRWSFAQIMVDVPVLMLRSNAWKITEQLLSITTDLDTPLSDPADLANLTDVETVLVNDDGSVSAP